jgi:hypothetical protein
MLLSLDFGEVNGEDDHEFVRVVGGGHWLALWGMKSSYRAILVV